MAFRPLTEAECGQSNPLSRLTSHITHDHTFSDSHGQVFQSSSDQLVEQFLQESRAIPQTFRMDDLMREMHEIESQRSVLPPIPASTVKDQLHDDSWALQYIEDGKRFNETSNNETVWAEIISQEQSQRGSQARADIWTTEILNAQPGPSDLFSLDEQLNGSLTDDSGYVYSKFMKFMKEEGDVNLEDGKLTGIEAQEWTDEYFRTEGKIDETEKVKSLAADWAEEHLRSKEEEFNTSFWDKLQEEMKKVSTSDADPAQPWIDEFNDYYNTPQKEYEFSEENPMLNIPKPLERGKQFLEDEDFPSAVLCFEAAAKQEPENVEAWLYLGSTQAKNEQELNAITAFNRCLQLDPTNLEALMGIAVSYTNENWDNQACQMLLNWLKNNPKYMDMVPSDLRLSGQVTSFLIPDTQKTVQELFIKAAQRHPQDIDYEVQCGLGLLFHITGECSKAADCFAAALSVKPNDATLWNRLGATLANGDRAEEAVDAYHHALNISPGFIRARYNVGITCIKLNAFQEAAEHFLTALNLQARGKDVVNSGSVSQMSGTIWASLRMCISFMNRDDLRLAIETKDLKELNRAFFID